MAHGFTQRRLASCPGESTKKRNAVYIDGGDGDLLQLASSTRATAESRKILLHTMEHGTQKSRNIRIMLLGAVGVGKTTFGKHLLEEPTTNIQSTNGIDVLTAYMIIDMEKEYKKKLGTGQEKNVVAQKIGSAMNSYVTTGALEQSANHSVQPINKEQVHMANDDNVFEEISETLEQFSLKEKDDRICLSAAVPKDEPREKTHRFESVADKKNRSGMVSDNKRTGSRTDRSESIQYRRKVKSLVNMEEVLIRSEMSGKEIGEIAYVSLWDFAGESVFYATHHIFLSDDAIYFVLFDLSRCLSEDLQFEHVLNWLEAIATYCDGIPPVILIGTHLDKLRGAVKERRLMADKIMHRLLEQDCIMKRKWRFLKTFSIDNMKPDRRDISQIWTQIKKGAKFQSQWGKTTPSKWLSLEHELMDMRASGKNVLTLNDIIEADKELDTPVRDIHCIVMLLTYLHDGGFVLFIRNENNLNDLNQIVIINPQWIVKAFRCIITSQKFRDGDELEIEWKKFEKTAKLPEVLIQFAWAGEFDKFKTTLLSAMETSGLITTPLEDESTTEKYYIVPSVLKQPDLMWLKKTLKSIKSIRLSSAFVFDFGDTNVPFHVFDKLLAKAVSKFKPYDLHDDNFIRRGFGFLQIPKRNLGFILHCKGSAIKITLVKVENQFEYGEGFILKQTIKEWLYQILNAAGFTKLRANHVECLHCKCHVDQMDEYIPIEDVHKEPQACCKLYVNLHTLSKNELAPWINDGTGKTNDDQIQKGNSMLPSGEISEHSGGNCLPVTPVQNQLQTLTAGIDASGNNPVHIQELRNILQTQTSTELHFHGPTIQNIRNAGPTVMGSENTLVSQSYDETGVKQAALGYMRDSTEDEDEDFD